MNNPERGESTIVIEHKAYTLRPTFTALVAAEEELGPLFALVERAGEGKLRLQEVAMLFWHCLQDKEGVTREQVGEAVIATGLSGSARPLRSLLFQVLQGRM